MYVGQVQSLKRASTYSHSSLHISRRSLAVAPSGCAGAARSRVAATASWFVALSLAPLAPWQPCVALLSSAAPALSFPAQPFPPECADAWVILPCAHPRRSVCLAADSSSSSE